MNVKNTAIIFLIIFLEGYLVLSSELLAIRLLVPFVGSGTDTVSIIIAAVLMPLAVGYYFGGRYNAGQNILKNNQGVRQKLIQNLLIASIFLMCGLSYVILDFLFRSIGALGFSHRLAITILYASVFLVLPVYLLGQTIPLISNYIRKDKLSKTTGVILFWSTLGSFLGALLSTLLFMSWLGVHNTVAINFVIFLILILILSKRKISAPVITSAAIALIAFGFNSNTMLGHYNIVENNQHNIIQTKSSKNGFNFMSINGNLSSIYDPYTGRRAEYIEYVERIALTPIPGRNKNILVLGAGGFTFGAHNKKHNFDFVDVDPSLKQIAEEQILKRKLNDNVIFHSVPARGFLSQTKKKYDLIFLDVYTGDHSIPEHLLTLEFFKQIKQALNPNGVMAANIVASSNFSNDYSSTLDNTIRAAFGNINRNILSYGFNMWQEGPLSRANIIYLYKHRPDEQSKTGIYTDNKNTSYLDKLQNGLPHNQKFK